MINNALALARLFVDQLMESQISPFAPTTIKQEPVKSESTDITPLQPTNLTPLQPTIVGELIPLHIQNLSRNDTITITSQS